MSKNLVIVESPAKAKTIEKILGADYQVTSSYGHIRDLIRGNAAIDTENGYNPHYEVPEDKKKVVNELKKLVKKSDAVLLATDEDREGEAISWHLCEVLGLDENTTQRIVFHEITKPAISAAVANPRIINKNVVNAQQARRVLDRLVGFGLSPVLWRKVRPKLSAGRVQSVAVRIIVEREAERDNFEAVSSYKIYAWFDVKDESGKVQRFRAELKSGVPTLEDAQAFLNSCINADYSIKNLTVKPKKTNPAKPFTTSTLQQDASKKFGYSVSKTMMLAQRLYEAGKITYMRTDSVNLSETALDAAKDAIVKKLGDKYYHRRTYATKSKGAQEAHEAIRPTYFEIEEAGKEADEKRLYKLIWQRTIASQMAPAEFERTVAKIAISTNDALLTAEGEVLKFDGFLSVYLEGQEDQEANDEKSKNARLPALTVGQVLDFQEMKGIQRFKNPPARFTEASLVKKMEELGIGRPSTYAPTIATIQRREYVVKEIREGRERKYQVLSLTDNKVVQQELTEITGAEKNKLFPTDMGILVTQFLIEHFPKVMNYEFTADIEKDFDEIAQGQQEWQGMIDEFYTPFKKDVDKAIEDAPRVSGERILGKDAKTGKDVLARLGRFGPMVQIGHQDDEEKPRYAKIRAPHTLGSITFEAAMEMFKLPRTLGEFEEKVIKASEGRFGPYVVHDGKFVSIPKDAEFDPFTVTLEQGIQLVKDKRESDAKKLIKTFDENEDLRILEGRWGPYIKFEKRNIKIPKERKEEPKTLTYEECMDLVENAPPPKKRGKR